ncbi:NAD(P)-dependent alcohol dehydrogenase [Novosphingobium colocasiae]|uniref:Aryl-alcohol dehydrogenase n=1 Tax=Novosphingobium colocasiae TaxID=1256513 RepID=A0A918UHU1_9SPHN|nr:NAD(P)-dependent alcohol dehydrogenase [Novosphingobium colocasiae]GGZ10218.1 aryl-alcohol dehydrogenase [Novosphingobium colocasiae]
MQITAAVAREPKQDFSLEQLELDEPQAGEVLVRIEAVGVCHSDIAARNQSLPVQMPVVLGHEGAGVVERVGPGVTKVKPGDKVVLTVGYCGQCTNCTRGDVAYCENGMAINYSGRRADGSPTLCCGGEPVSGHFFAQSSFASYAIALEQNTVKVHDGADLALAAPLGCGVQTGAGAVLRSLAAKPGRAIAVFGAGSVGLSAVMGAVVAGCDPIIVVEPVAARRALALEVGATQAIDPAAGDIAEAIRAIVARGVDYVVETTAVDAVVSAALASLAGHGEMAFLGVPKNPEATFSTNLLGFLASGVTLKAVIEGDTDPDTFIPELLAHVEAGRMPLGKLVRTYPFDQINQAIDDQLSGLVVKPVLTF